MICGHDSIPFKVIAVGVFGHFCYSSSLYAISKDRVRLFQPRRTDFTMLNFGEQLESFIQNAPAAVSLRAIGKNLRNERPEHDLPFPKVATEWRNKDS